MNKKFFWTTITLLLVTELLSYFVFASSQRNILAGIILALVAVICFSKPKYGILIFFAELFIGGKGWLFWINVGELSLTLRMVIFVAVILSWLFNSWHEKNLVQQLIPHDRLTQSFYTLIAAIILYTFFGLMQNTSMNVYADANAWFFFLLFFPIRYFFKNTDIWAIFDLLAASVLTVTAKTYLALIIFSRHIIERTHVFYHWIRQTGVGEITQLDENFFRIFFQSHIYSLLALIIFLAFFSYRIPLSFRRLTLYVSASAASILTLIISQSRSLWVGAAIGLFLIVLGVIIFYKKNFATAFLLFSLFGVIFFSHLSLIRLGTGYAGNIFSQRLSQAGSDESGASRVAQLQPLISAIKKRPIFGYGFGKTLTYKSSDPRILETYPDGVYTTHAFEWGYLDMLLKLGLLGILILGAYYFFTVKALLGPNFGPTGAVFLALLALGIVHIFTPYLNHPLGIGFLLFSANINKNIIYNKN